MNGFNLKKSFTLFIGDAIILLLSLVLGLFIRTGHWPDFDTLSSHFLAFIPVFILWLLIFFIYDFYSSVRSDGKLKDKDIKVFVINLIIATFFFYFFPYFGLAPKTNLFVITFLSFVFLWIWRNYLASLVFDTERQRIVLLGELTEEMNEIQEFLSKSKNEVIVAREINQLISIKPKMIIFNRYAELDFTRLFSLLPQGVVFLSADEFYEEIFGRIPLSLINEKWFLENISFYQRKNYDSLKRLIDLLVGIVGLIITLPFYPIITLAIWLEGGTPFFFNHPIMSKRVGKGDKVFKVYKFRSTNGDKLMKVGNFLRKSRLDEIPQFINIIKGDLSLVGPRPEIYDYVEKYKENIPYYNTRHLILPGLSGWAQIYQENHSHFGLNKDSTAEKLSYDLYYLKHRSLTLDIKIILKTLRILTSRAGR